MADSATLVAGQPGGIISTSWSARVISGVKFSNTKGASISFGGEYGGLGANYKIWTSKIKVSIPF